MSMTKNTPASNTADAPARIPVTLPRPHAGEDPNLFVSVNGKNYLIPRGTTSHVPPEIAAEVARAERARERAEQNSRRMLGA